MTKSDEFVCVNCGKKAASLYRTYGPSVLKVNKCKSCKCVVDKYIEYDNVIVMIDVILISEEAQRHVIYNIEFQSYWKLFIVLTLLETYGVWRNDSLLNIGINSLCNIQTNSTINSTYLHFEHYFQIPKNRTLPEWWEHQCKGWVYEERIGNDDLFIWEKDFYVQFMSTFAGIFTFILTTHVMMKLLKPLSASQREVSLKYLLKAFSLANVSTLFTLPMLVWGSAVTSVETRTIHYALVFAYSFVVFFSTFTVLFEAPIMVTLATLTVSNVVKYLTTFISTPFLHRLDLWQ